MGTYECFNSVAAVRTKIKVFVLLWSRVANFNCRFSVDVEMEIAIYDIYD